MDSGSPCPTHLTKHYLKVNGYYYASILNGQCYQRDFWAVNCDTTALRSQLLNVQHGLYSRQNVPDNVSALAWFIAYQLFILKCLL